MIAEPRDYVAWHEAYDDPDSNLSWRLSQVRTHLHRALDERSGPVRIVSSCAGDGRDVIGVLREREDHERVNATLLEVHPQLTEQARVAAFGLDGVQIRTVDAGRSDAYAGAVPADVVLLVGIFGNIADDDVERTVRATPQLCAPRATLVWSRGRGDTVGTADMNDTIRGWFSDVGFAETDYAVRDHGSRPAIGVHRFDGEPQPLVPGQHLFTFLR